MSRPLRVEYPGALYHVTSRGSERGTIFRDERDHDRRIFWLARTVEACRWRLHAYALMTNHDHLLIETPEPNLSKGMQLLNSAYTSYFNLRHGRAGHLFQGRYKAILVEEEGHYRELSRYIHLNPVRAGMARQPEQWQWSSCAAYFRGRRKPPWLTCERVLAEFGADESAARAAYRRFLLDADHPAPSPLRGVAYGFILGSDRFVARICRLLAPVPDNPEQPALRRMRNRPSVERIAAMVAAHFALDPAAWRRGRRSDHIGRALAAYLARWRYGHSAAETARALGYARSGSIAQACDRVERNLARLSPTLKQVAAALGTGEA